MFPKLRTKIEHLYNKARVLKTPALPLDVTPSITPSTATTPVATRPDDKGKAPAVDENNQSPSTVSGSPKASPSADDKLASVLAITLPPPSKVSFVVPESEDATYRYNNDLLKLWLKNMYLGGAMDLTLKGIKPQRYSAELLKLFNLSFIIDDVELMSSCIQFTHTIIIDDSNVSDLYALSQEPKCKNEALANKCLSWVSGNKRFILQKGSAKSWSKTFLLAIFRRIQEVGLGFGSDEEFRALVESVAFASQFRKVDDSIDTFYQEKLAILNTISDTHSELNSSISTFMYRGTKSLVETLFESNCEEGLAAVTLNWVDKYVVSGSYTANEKGCAYGIRPPRLFAPILMAFLHKYHEKNPGWVSNPHL